MMKAKLFVISVLSAVAMAASCGVHEDVVFDTPFVTLMDKTKSVNEMTVAKTARNLLTELCVSVNASNSFFKDSIVVEYEIIVGDGLAENVDYRLQASTASPLVFYQGTYDMPIRLIWLKNLNLDPEKDNTLEVRLTSTSIPGMLIGRPGVDALCSSFKFTRE